MVLFEHAIPEAPKPSLGSVILQIMPAAAETEVLLCLRSTL